MFDPYGYIQREQDAMRDQEMVNVSKNMCSSLIAVIMKQQADIIMLSSMCELLNSIIETYKEELGEDVSSENIGNIFGA